MGIANLVIHHYKLQPNYSTPAISMSTHTKQEKLENGSFSMGMEVGWQPRFPLRQFEDKSISAQDSAINHFLLFSIFEWYTIHSCDYIILHIPCCYNLHTHISLSTPPNQEENTQTKTKTKTKQQIEFGGHITIMSVIRIVKSNNLESCCLSRIFGGQRNLAGMLPTALPTQQSLLQIAYLSSTTILFMYIYILSRPQQSPQTQESGQSYSRHKKGKPDEE